MKKINMLVLIFVLVSTSMVLARDVPVIYSGSDLISTSKDQDRLDVKHKLNGDEHKHFFGVYDGHGDLNVHVAQVVKEKVGEQVATNIASNLPVEQAIEDALDRAEHHVTSKKYQEGGTTAVNALVDGTTLYLSNVGDSRAVLVRSNDSGELVAYQPIEDHALENAQELERLKNIGAQISIRGCFTHNVKNSYRRPDWVCPKQGPHSLAIDLYGSRFTRSIGDALSKKHAKSQVPNNDDVILAAPDIVKINLTSSDKFLILASDGVWEESLDNPITNEEAVALVGAELAKHANKEEGASAAAQALAQEAKNRWGGDDISVVIVVFDWSDPPLSFGQKMMRDLALGGINAALIPAHIRKLKMEEKMQGAVPSHPVMTDFDEDELD